VCDTTHLSSPLSRRARGTCAHTRDALSARYGSQLSTSLRRRLQSLTRQATGAWDGAAHPVRSESSFGKRAFTKVQAQMVRSTTVRNALKSKSADMLRPGLPEGRQAGRLRVWRDPAVLLGALQRLGVHRRRVLKAGARTRHWCHRDVTALSGELALSGKIRCTSQP